MSHEIADRVADWCQVETATFQLLYERWTAGTDAASWSVLVAGPTAAGRPQSTSELKRLACREALRVQVLGELVLSFSKIQYEFGPSFREDADRIVADFFNANVGGRMQAIVGPGGLLGRETLQGTLAVDSATAIVYRNQRVVGTAFLAAPDLVMTAGHVVLSSNGNDFEAALQDGLSFSFRGPGKDSPPVVAYPAAKDPLAAQSLPWGRPPNLLHIAPVEDSPKRLDYALIRLDREVRHVEPLNVASPPKPESSDALVILGFAGGTAMKWHVGSVESVEAARLRHRANALAGMSGSCCINVDGLPIALHEGSLLTQTFAIDGTQNVAGANRATCLWVIRNAMASGQADPLVRRKSPQALEFRDEILVRRWAKTGLRFATNGLAVQWRNFVREAIGTFPDEAGAVDDFHPWFTRSNFEDWVDQHKTVSDSGTRLCVVSGNPGTGKSFLAAVLRKRVPDEVRDVVVISATETTAWSWREAIQQWGVELAATDGLRPDAGVAMHDEAPKAAEKIAHHGDRQGVAATPRPLFVFIDFDGNASFQTGEDPPWLPFMSELLGYPWVRLVVAGAPESVATALIDLMEDRDLGRSLRVKLEHIGQDDFRVFARRVLRKGRDTVPPDEIKDALHSFTRTLEAFPAPLLATTVAVLAAILLRKKLGN